jgi:hypothetical protein
MLGNLSRQQPVAILGKDRVIPHRVIDPKPNKPAKQQVKMHPLHELTL